MTRADRNDLTAAQEVLTRVLADAIVEDIIEAGGLDLYIRCESEQRQRELAERLEPAQIGQRRTR